MQHNMHDKLVRLKHLTIFYFALYTLKIIKEKFLFHLFDKIFKSYFSCIELKECKKSLVFESSSFLLNFNSYCETTSVTISHFLFFPHSDNLFSLQVDSKAELRRAFYACVYCIWWRFQRNYLGWLKPT